MFETIELPMWFVVIAAIFAAIAALERALIPSVRWFFRRRMERVVSQLNARLDRPIEPFKLARRHDMIQRLLYHPDVMQAVNDHARKEGIPENVAFQEAQKYAREIVPSFSATVYFTVASTIARFLSETLYRVRIGRFEDVLSGLDPKATVVFVMNHRSNMDYVLVT
jgi:glycerol-3-phosphate O-acyltransferase